MPLHQNPVPIGTHRKVGDRQGEALEATVRALDARVHRELESQEPPVASLLLLGALLLFLVAAAHWRKHVALEPLAMTREAQDGPGGADGVGHDDPRPPRAGETEDGPREDRVELRVLRGAPGLVAAVRRLNLGVLPVPCPPRCYKLALNNDPHKLSHAAVALRVDQVAATSTTTTTKTDDNGAVDDDDDNGDEDEDQDDRLVGLKRATKRPRHRDPPACGDLRDDEDAARAVDVVAGVLAEHDPIHKLVHVQTLAVAAGHRRRGLGRRLMTAVIDRAREIDGVTCVQLHVHQGNSEARAFYASLGFVEHGRLDNYYRQLSPRTALILRLPLEKEG